MAEGCITAVAMLIVYGIFLALATLLFQWLAALLFGVNLTFWLTLFVLWAIKFVINFLFK